MAAADANAVLRAGGRLYRDPTDLNDVPNGLGVELGTVVGGVLEPGYTFEEVYAEEHGRNVEAVRTSNLPIFSIVLRAWDLDALRTIFPNTADVGGTHRRIQGTGPVEPGDLVSDASVQLLFVSRNIADPSLLIQRALPLVAPTSALNLMITRELNFAAVFIPMEASNGELWTFDVLTELEAFRA